MSFYLQPWDKAQLRKQIAVVQGAEAPTKVLTNSTYLNAHTKAWEQANIWIYEDRIVYVGKRMPKPSDQTEVIDCSERFIVPGYIEPHAHPFQLYHPHTLAAYAAERGTTTLVCDNIVFFMLLPDEQSFDILDRLNTTPTSFFWWCRYDAQTVLQDSPFNDERMEKWLSHPNVIQGGELTSWPQVLHGDDTILEWMRMTKAHGKRIEGHLPGASEKTLTQMELLGVDCDHEAMTGEEAMTRLRMGLTTSLRYSSIRPDLPDILKDLIAQGLTNFEHVLMTTDGATPTFYKQGIMDRTIEIAMEQGVPTIDAYMMASTNPAKHYGMNQLIGEIAPGRIAHINILESPDQPTPISVLAKGEWVKRDGKVSYPESPVSFKDELGPLDIDWDVAPEHLEPESNIGIEMVNAVITRSFQLEEKPAEDQLPEGMCYLTIIDAAGHWRISTYVKGFASELDGFASSFSSTGDLILIGRKKADIIRAFQHLKEINGGIVLVENGQPTAELRLSIRGWLSEQPMHTLAEEEKALVDRLREKGYQFADPIYSLLFFSATHLPYIRITQQGLYDVLRGKVLQPPTSKV